MQNKKIKEHLFKKYDKPMHFSFILSLVAALFFLPILIFNNKIQNEIEGSDIFQSGQLQGMSKALAANSLSSENPSVDVAGWRSSDYGMQDPQAVCQGTGAYGGKCSVQPSYWIAAAQGMAAKFPGSQPGGIYTIGFIQNMGTEMPAELKTDLNGMSSVTFSAAGQQANPEVMLNAFDAAGLKIILAVEPGNANINQLATKLLNKYKHHPSVVGFGIDNEWFKTEKGNVKMTAAEATTFRDAIESVNPAYKTIIKHFDSTMLPKGIPRVIYLTDTCNFSSLNAAVTDYVAWANTFAGSQVGYQFGYDLFEVGSPDDQLWWGPLGTNGTPAKVITDKIMTARPSTDIYSVYWADFTIKTQFPLNYSPSQTPTHIPTPTTSLAPTPHYVTPTIYCMGSCPTGIPTPTPKTITTPIQPSPKIPTPTIDPCITSTVSSKIQNEASHKSKNKNEPRGFMQKLLAWLIDLINLLLRLLGLNPIPTDPVPTPKPTIPLPTQPVITPVPTDGNLSPIPTPTLKICPT